MKKQEIKEHMETGGAFAFAPYKGYRGKLPTTVQRVTVTKLDQKRQTYPSVNGPRIRFLDGPQAGDTKVIRSGQLLSTWGDYLKAKAAENKEKAEVEALEKASRGRANRLIDLFCDKTGFPRESVKLSTWGFDDEIEIDIEDLAEFLGESRKDDED